MQETPFCTTSGKPGCDDAGGKGDCQVHKRGFWRKIRVGFGFGRAGAEIDSNSAAFGRNGDRLTRRHGATKEGGALVSLTCVAGQWFRGFSLGRRGGMCYNGGCSMEPVEP